MKIFTISEATICHWEREQTENIPVSMYPKIVEFLNYCPIEKISHEGEKLALFRKYSGRTQKQLAKELNCDERYITSWENGQYLIPYEKGELLHGIFGYTFTTAQPNYKHKIPKDLITTGDHLKAKRLKQRMSVKNALTHFSISASSAYRNWEGQEGIEISAKYYPEIVAFLNYCPIETFTTAGEKLSIYRKYAGLTQSELAEKIGCHDVTIAKWEKGQSRISKEHVKNIQRIWDRISSNY